MAQEKITYNDKTNNHPITDREKQIVAEDLNELKEVINSNADDVDDNKVDKPDSSQENNIPVFANDSGRKLEDSGKSFEDSLSGDTNKIPNSSIVKGIKDEVSTNATKINQNSQGINQNSQGINQNSQGINQNSQGINQNSIEILNNTARISTNEYDINILKDNQTTGIVQKNTYTDLVATAPVENISFKVTNDPDTSLNGYYHFEGTNIVKDADLANGLVEVGNVDAVSGNEAFFKINDSAQQGASLWNSLSNRIESFKWIQGSFDTATGGDVSSSTQRLYTPGIIPVDDVFAISVDNSLYSFAYTGFDINGQVTENGAWFSSRNYFKINTRYVRLMLRFNNDSTITGSDVAASNFSLTTKLGKFYSEFEFYNQISTRIYNDLTLIKWINYGFNSESTGEIDDTFNDVRVSSLFLIPMRDVKMITIGDGYDFVMSQYDDNGDFLEGNTWVSIKFNFNPNCKYIRLGLRKSDNSEISPDDIINSEIKIQYLDSIDELVSRGYDYVYNKNSNAISFINNNFDAATGEVSEAITMLRVVNYDYIISNNLRQLSIASGYQFVFTALDKENNIVENQTNWIGDPYIFTSKDIYKIRIAIRKPDNSEISTNEDFGIKLIPESFSESPSFRFNETNIVNNFDLDTLCHASIVIEDVSGDDGVLYAGYYNSENARVEYYENDFKCTLAKIDPCDLSNPILFTALEKNQQVGDFEQSGVQSPYDPALFLDSNNVYYYMVANNKNDSEGVRYVMREFDKSSDSFLNSIEDIFIRYTHNSVEYTETLSTSNMNTMIERLQNRTGVDVGLYPIFSPRIIESQGYRWAFLGGLSSNGNGFEGCVINSIDGEIWDFVSFANTNYLDVWEGAIEIVGSKIFLMIRKDFVYSIMSYDFIDDEWSEEIDIYGNMSRPFLLYTNSKLYAYYNTYPNVQSTAGQVKRSTMAISVIDIDNFSIVDTQYVYAQDGCQYMSVCDMRGRSFLMFTEDKRRYDLTAMKGQISIVPMDFVNV